ncbi:hypothetical protein ABB37_04293 [Leptomonas pyrrhocoris]|uniref:Protein kinase domain-containing protein n=1 Tax=Leptomonas pyrrhocoris TaxID=157538 RepID=A0A0N0DVU9_LEPPY|nr:hypothetical protein ABB37_04293 [Leptomonas pyrrhocoris]KPA80884.1 hypothetical protein ABB37_04293 [Leptomonas pyrrhocoris]|eukprot:XP_015659323.1 hypothetical protein ABB37_04293 [Leptomonas pyrrhocoris]
MATSKTFLDSVHHISEHSIFFLASHGDNLDLKTLSSAPPCHRAVLQRNGLVAKIYAAISFPGEDDRDTYALSRRRRDHEAEDASVKRAAFSFRGRQEVWRSALTYAGLLSHRDAEIHIPHVLQTTPWPYLTPAQYRDNVKQAIARATCVAVNGSSFCVPILSLQEYVYKRYDMELSLAVMWMPCYPQSLRQWAVTFNAAGKPIPEALLLAMLHHITIAQLTVRSGDTIAGRSATAAAAASVPTCDSIVVHQNGSAKDTRAADWNDEPVFLLSASACEERTAARADSLKNGDASPTSLADTALPLSQTPPPPSQQQLPLYRPPEECNPTLYPPLVPGSTKRVVWGLGIVLYLLASGRVHLPSPQHAVELSDNNGNNNRSVLRSPRRARVIEEVPLNAAAMTPDVLWRRLRRDLEPRGYGGTLTTVVAQLLSLDPSTRPSLTTVDRVLQDLHRLTPIRRFPFALGGYDLLRLPNPTGTVELNPGARRYTFAEVCVLCKKPRSGAAVCPKGGDHQSTGITSPSWSDEGDLLPAVGLASESTYTTFLYPLCAAANGRQRRKHAAHALQSPNASMSVVASASASCCTNATQDVAPLNCGFLLQVFGGFAVYERRPEQNSKGQVIYTVKVREVLIPYPSQGLRRSELSLVKTTIEFSGGLPWPSCCTETMQKGGRVSRHVPFALTGAHHDVEWFGWVLPGERFAMPNGAHWTAPLGGAFVFWFAADLQPTDRDRYFAVTNVRSATLPAKVPRTFLPDSLFRQHVGDENQISAVLLRSAASYNSHSEAQVGQPGLRSSAARRRSNQSVTDVVLPSATREIVEDDEDGLAAADVEDVVLHSLLSRPVSRNACRTQDTTFPRSTRRRRDTTAHPRRLPSCQVSVVVAHSVVEMRDEEGEDTVKAIGEKRKQSSAIYSTRESATSKENVAVAPSHTMTTTPNAQNTTPLKQPSQLWCKTPEPHVNGTRPRAGSAAAAAATGLDNDTLASEATPSKHSTPAAHGSVSSREGTQPPSHRDTSATNVRGLAPLPVNEAFRASRGSAKEEKRRKARIMLGAEAPRAAAPQGTADVAPTNLSSQASAPNSALQLPSGFATPTFAAQKLPPLSHAACNLGGLHVCAQWLPVDAVDAAFQALTFWVLSTGEHGYMHAPVKMSVPMGYALRAPPGAVYVSFLSNEVPLFRRNHPGMDVAIFSPLLPHHGFACYNAERQLLGVLALRCSTKEDADVTRGEFEVTTHVREPCVGSQVSSRAIYASYLSGSVGDEKAMLREKPGEAEPMNHLRRSLSFSQAGLDSRAQNNTPCDAQTLTFTSARHLIGEFTPHEEDDFSLRKESTALLPACWMGFDGGSGCLLFSDVGQFAWVPYGIGE